MTCNRVEITILMQQFGASADCHGSNQTVIHFADGESGRPTAAVEVSRGDVIPRRLRWDEFESCQESTDASVALVRARASQQLHEHHIA